VVAVEVGVEVVEVAVEVVEVAVEVAAKVEVAVARKSKSEIGL
jgi:hypothetical protein